MNSLVSRLINFAKINLGLNDFDVSYVSNKIFDILQIQRLHFRLHSVEL